MKCICFVVFLAIGLQSLRGDDEVTEISTETSTAIDKDGNTTDSGKNYDENDMNDLEARLPSDSQSIRSNIIDTKFSCRDHDPGYYADVDNECQIFHRCLEGQERVFSFICPEQTIFSQRALVCVWNDTRDLDCGDSEGYYEESNRAFSGNKTAESNINENMKNSTEIIDMESDEDDGETDETQTNGSPAKIKFTDSSVNPKHEVVKEESETIEKNSVEENVEKVEETEEFHEFQAELIPSLIHDIDASVSAAELDSASHPQKISLSVLDPIIEMPSRDEDELQLHPSESSRNIRKRSGNHRNRFLFKADAH